MIQKLILCMSSQWSKSLLPNWIQLMKCSRQLRRNKFKDEKEKKNNNLGKTLVNTGVTWLEAISVKKAVSNPCPNAKLVKRGIWSQKLWKYVNSCKSFSFAVLFISMHREKMAGLVVFWRDGMWSYKPCSFIVIFHKKITRTLYK